MNCMNNFPVSFTHLTFFKCILPEESTEDFEILYESVRGQGQHPGFTLLLCCSIEGEVSFRS